MYIVQSGLFGLHRISVRSVITLYPRSIMLKLGEEKTYYGNDHKKKVL